MSPADLPRTLRPVAVVFPQQRSSLSTDDVHNNASSSFLAAVESPDNSLSEISSSQMNNGSVRKTMGIVVGRQRNCSDDEQNPLSVSHSVSLVAESRRASSGEVCADHRDVVSETCITVDNELDSQDNLRYYHGRISSADAQKLLAGKPVGTFLLRDSSNSDQGFPLAISVVISTDNIRTRSTSIRISRDQFTGNYRLDCVKGQCLDMPDFRSVGSFIDFLVKSSAAAAAATSGDVNSIEAKLCKLVDSRGRINQPLMLKEPLLVTQPRSSRN